ncbi:MAG: hypothetical protein D6678_08180 [Zetaproteobacteria bacterium]|nr:MAG: hypothetical protein D6678_08180 [Zetaproteobacteria bacterium]
MTVGQGGLGMNGMRYALLLALLVGLSTCGGDKPDVTDESIQPPKAKVVEKVPVVKPMTVEERLAKLEQIKRSMKPHFVLGKGDVLSLSVYGEPDLTVKGIPVRPDGKVAFPLIGDVQVEGKTVDQVSKEVTRRLREYLRTPKVAIMVEQFNSLSYTIAGEVTKPGVYPLKGDVTLTQAFAMAGGLKQGSFRSTTVELADLTHTFLARNGKILPIDFERLLRQGDIRFDIKLAPGDYIYVPSGLSKQIYLLGEVTRPNLYAFKAGFTVSTALTKGEGFTPDADLSRVHVIRGSLDNPQLFILDMNKVLEGEETDMRLQPNDIVYVPPTYLTRWSRMLSKILPSLQMLQTGVQLTK